MNGQVFDNLPKRRAVLQIVKAIVEAGVSPETLQLDITWQYLYFKAPGRLTSEQMQAAIADAGSDVIRYFTAESELLYFEDSTYAVSNQWGPRSLQAVESMIASCPTVSIGCDPMT